MSHRTFDIPKNRNWLVVGAAPGADAYFTPSHRWAMREPKATRIATNAAWQLFATEPNPFGVTVPDYYWVSDGVACALFARAIRWMRHCDTQVVSLARNPIGLEIRGLDQVDPMLLPLPEREDNAPQYKVGEWCHPRLSGLICLQIAANCLAPGGTVVLVGMTGYRSSGGKIATDTFDGRLGKAAGEQHTRDWIGPFTRSVVAAHPETTFVVAGTPRYDIAGDNVIVATSPDHLAQALRSRS